VIAYDTIYALQDREDDALVGVRSTARLFGAPWRAWTAVFYVGAIIIWGVAAATAGAGLPAIAALALVSAFLVSRLIDRVDPENPASALAAFKFNVVIGLAAAAAFALNPLWVTLAPRLRHLGL
jgi:4-hydroxybenzoate polyprenyltransferase